MGELIRAGGHVLCDSGWEPLDSPAGRAAVAHAAGVTGEAQPAASPEPVVNSGTGEQPSDDELLGGDPEPVVLLEPEHEPVELEPVETVDFGASSDRATCPDCGKEVALRKDGSLRKHRCTEGDE